jgi:hypothetical protein
MPYYSQLLLLQLSSHSLNKQTIYLLNLEWYLVSNGLCHRTSPGEDDTYIILTFDRTKILHQNGAVAGDWRLDIIDSATNLSF